MLAGLAPLALHAATAAGGLALAGSGVLAMRAPAGGHVRRSADAGASALDGIDRAHIGRRPPAGLATMAMGNAAALLTPAARRSTILRRASADRDTRRRLAIAGSSSWVALACVVAAGRRSHRCPPEAELGGGAAVLDALAGVRLAAGTSVLAVGASLTPLLGPMAVLVAAPLAVAALFAPDLALSAHSRRSAAAASTAMPEALELLAACCRGGLPLEAALEVAVHHTADPVRGVLARARRRQVAGQNPATALRVEAELVGIDELVALGRLVDRHHHLGLPLEAPLLARADAARARAHTEALDRAGRAVPLASLVTAMVVAPCCVAILAVWVIAATVARSGLA